MVYDVATESCVQGGAWCADGFAPDETGLCVVSELICSDGLMLAEDGVSCMQKSRDCANDYFEYNEAMGRCVHRNYGCEAGKYWSLTREECVEPRYACDSGFAYDVAYKTCVLDGLTCKAGFRPADDGESCVQAIPG